MTSPINDGVGYPVNTVIDGNLSLVDVYGTGQYGNLTARSITTVAPSGDTTGATDITNINAALTAAAPGMPVKLRAGIWYINTPILPPPGSVLMGDFSNEVAQTSEAAWGTVIRPTANFSIGTAPTLGIIVTQDTATGGYSVTSDEQKLYGFMIDCSLLTTGTADGIVYYGQISRPRLDRVLVMLAPGNGINVITTGAGGPGQFHMSRVNVLNAGLAGFNLPKQPDMTLVDCLAETCGGDGFTLQNMPNSVMIGCRSEHNGGNGYTWTCTSPNTGSAGFKMIGCSSDRNEHNGIAISSTNNSGFPIALVGCCFRRDGRNGNNGGGGYAGISVTSFPGSVLISGSQVWPGISDNGSGTNSPQIGLAMSGNSSTLTSVAVSASYIQGASTAVSDDGSEAAVFYDGMIQATGTTASPSPVFTSSISATASTGNLFTVTNQHTNPANATVQLTATTGGDRLLGVNVTGDTKNRYQVNSNGDIQWGPGGSSNVDCKLARQSSNLLSITTADLAIDTAGRGLQIKEGSNARQGTTTLNGTTAVVVANTSITASTRILLSIQDSAVPVGIPYVSARSAGTSFSLKSTSASDTSVVVAWLLTEPAP